MDLSGILIDFDIGVWASIFSNLEISDINEFEQIPEYFYVLANKTFWIELIRQRLFKYYVPQAVGYEWKQLYVYLLNFDTRHQRYLSDSSISEYWLYSSLNEDLQSKNDFEHTCSKSIRCVHRIHINLKNI